MFDIVHRIGIKATPARIYAALTTLDGLSAWWTRSVSGDPSRGGTLVFRFQGQDGVERGSFHMEVRESSGERRVGWRVVAGPPEWVGTSLDFDLKQVEGQTLLSLAHRGWREQSDFMSHCSMKWATFLLSLRSFVEDGAGRPAPDDLRVDELP